MLRTSPTRDLSACVATGKAHSSPKRQQENCSFADADQVKFTVQIQTYHIRISSWYSWCSPRQISIEACLSLVQSLCAHARALRISRTIHFGGGNSHWCDALSFPFSATMTYGCRKVAVEGCMLCGGTLDEQLKNFIVSGRAEPCATKFWCRSRRLHDVYWCRLRHWHDGQ